MRKINRKFGIVQLSGLLVVAFLAATPTANAGEPLCELDWNSDGIVDWGDYYKEHMDGTVSGFYVDVYRHIHFASGIYGSRYNPELDWNGDGVITMEDAGWRDEEGATAVEGSFHEQLYLFINWALELGYTHYYEEWYPESDCNDLYTENPEDSETAGKKKNCWARGGRWCPRCPSTIEATAGGIKVKIGRAGYCEPDKTKSCGGCS